MSIPRSLIIYRAPRYQENYPLNIKHRYYSDKILLSTEVLKTDRSQIFRWEYHPKITNMTKTAQVTKFTRKLSLYLEAGNQNKLQTMRYFPKLKSIKECFIHFHNETESFAQKVPTLLARAMIQRAFKTLKQLEQVEMNKLGPLQKDPRTFKPLILQRSLQKLSLIDLKYTDDPRHLESFLRLSQSVSKRGCWPHLKHLRIGLSPSEEPIRNVYDFKNVTGTLQNLLKFLQDFKDCELLNRRSHFQLRFPDKERTSPSEVAALDEILAMQLPIAQVFCCQSIQIIKLFEVAEHSEELQSISLRLHDSLSDPLDMNVLCEFPALQEIKLRIECSDEDDDEDPNVHFYYSALEEIQSMTNLISLSLDFEGDRGDVQAELDSALANLSELRYLRLKWAGWETDGEGMALEINRSWLKDVFQAISKMKKLKELSLDLENFDCNDSSRLFKNLWQSIGKLTQLTSLRFSIEFAQEINDQNVSTLVSHLSKLKKLESLSLRIADSKFETSTFVLVMDSIVQNFYFLSNLDVEFHGFNVTKQCYQLIYEAIHQLKYLNKMEILIGCSLESGLNIALLDAEVRRRMEGSVYCYSIDQ